MHDGAGPLCSRGLVAGQLRSASPARALAQDVPPSARLCSVQRQSMHKIIRSMEELTAAMGDYDAEECQ